jgi:hypothetical protein
MNMPPIAGSAKRDTASGFFVKSLAFYASCFCGGQNFVFLTAD